MALLQTIRAPIRAPSFEMISLFRQGLPTLSNKNINSVTQLSRTDCHIIIQQAANITSCAPAQGPTWGCDFTPPPTPTTTAPIPKHEYR